MKTAARTGTRLDSGFLRQLGQRGTFFQRCQEDNSVRRKVMNGIVGWEWEGRGWGRKK